MGLFEQRERKTITKARVIGVRTAEDTKTLVTYNYGVYSFLVEYSDGTRGIVESKPKERDWDALMSALVF